MKKLALAMIVFVAGQQASAICFNFINQKGPKQAGIVRLQNEGGSYTATKACITTTSGGGSYDSLALSDSEGDLLIVAVNKGVGRCGPNEYCVSLKGLSGQALGRNLTAQEAQSIDITIMTNKQSNIGMFTGTYEDQTSREKLLISEAIRR